MRACMLMLRHRRRKRAPQKWSTPIDANRRSEFACHGRRRLARSNAYGNFLPSSWDGSLTVATQAPLGEFSALNHSQLSVLKSSPPRTKRLFVLAEASRSQSKSFIPTLAEKAACAPKVMLSPSKPRVANRESTSSVVQIGARAKDDATFLALLHIEPLVDRDLFRLAFCRHKRVCARARACTF
jgi:hypothetical protein